MSVYSGCLKDIMTNIFNTAKTTAETYGLGTDYLAGANIAAFENVAKAMVLFKILCSILNHNDWGFLYWFQKSSLFLIVSLKTKIYFTSTKAEDRHSTISFTASSMFTSSLSFNIIGIT